MRSQLTTLARALVVATSFAMLGARPAAAVLPGGSPDPGFAGGGVRTLPTVPISKASIVKAIGDGAGGVLGAAVAEQGENLVVAVVHRNASGAPVAAFGGGDGDVLVALPVVLNAVLARRGRATISLALTAVNGARRITARRSI